MKVLFVYPNMSRYLGVPIGVSSLISLIREKGYNCDLFDATFYKDEELISEYTKLVRGNSYDIIMFHCISPDWELVQIFLNSIYENSLKGNIKTIVGAQHPTIVPEEVISNELVDILVIGEGELVVSELLYNIENNIDIRHIRNCWIRENGRIYKNPLRPLIQDLNSLPYPVWDIFDSQHKMRNGKEVANIETTRGCPYSCSFCMNSALRKIFRGLGNYYREKSVDRIIAEAKYAKETLGIQFIQFIDDNFVGSLRRLKELSFRFPKEVGLPIAAQASADKLNDTTLKLLSDMGTEIIALGVESGNEKYRKKILNKNVSDEEIINAIRLARSYGIATMAYYMIGLPLEKRKYIEQTIEFNQIAQPDRCIVSIFFPFPGTALYDAVLKNDLLERTDYMPDFYESSVLKFEDLNADDFNEIRKKFPNAILKMRPLPLRSLERIKQTKLQ